MKKTGVYSPAGDRFQLTDLHSIALSKNGNDANGIDESIASRGAYSSSRYLIINVVDASCSKSLYALGNLQLRELGRPMIVVLNKMDVVKREGVRSVTTKALEKELGCRILSLSANDKGQVVHAKNAFISYFIQGVSLDLTLSITALVLEALIPSVESQFDDADARASASDSSLKMITWF